MASKQGRSAALCSSCWIQVILRLRFDIAHRLAIEPSDHHRAYTQLSHGFPLMAGSSHHYSYAIACTLNTPWAQVYANIFSTARYMHLITAT